MARKGTALLALAGLLAACESPSGSSRPGPAARMEIVSGDPQTDTVGQPLPQPLAVRVTDARGRPVPGAPVGFRVTAGGGSLAASTAVTDDAGEARGQWTLGTVAGDTQRVEAHLAEGETPLTAAFRAVGVADAPAAAVAASPPLRIGWPDGSPSPSPVAVKVTDRHGNPAPGVAVAFAAPAGLVLPAADTTGPDGIARTEWLYGLAITATVAGLPPVVMHVERSHFRASQVSVGGQAACAVRGDGAAFCWGSDSFGLIGDERNTAPERCNWGWGCHAYPTRVAGGHTFSRIDVGEYLVCGLTTAGAAYCWGYGGTGGLGNGGTQSSEVPVPVSGGHSFVRIEAGSRFACALTAGGEAWCWGSGHGLGTGDATLRSSPVPVRVRGDLHFTSLAAGDGHACGIAGGRAYCWGENGSGQLGIGSTWDAVEPVRVAGDLRFQAISAGGRTTCALTEAGAAYCWGSNQYDALGGGFGDQSLPLHTVRSEVFREIHTGGTRTCALRPNGTAVCWGAWPRPPGPRDTNPWYQSSEPGSPSADVFRAVASGPYTSCGIDTAGHLRCWASNAFGLLGNGSWQDSAAPVYVVPRLE